MKIRFSLVSNSSSTSFIIHTANIKDENLYAQLISVINDGNYVEPNFENRFDIYVSTGMSDGNECIYNWWKIKKWLVDHKIEHEDQGDGCPGPEQKASDFVLYIIEKDNEQEVDPLRALEFKHWLFRDIPNKRIDNRAAEIGITKEEIKNNKFNLDLYEDILKE